LREILAGVAPHQGTLAQRRRPRSFGGSSIRILGHLADEDGLLGAMLRPRFRLLAQDMRDNFARECRNKAAVVHPARLFGFEVEALQGTSL
jgi:hypothetical protein